MSPWLVSNGVRVGCVWAPYLYLGVHIIHSVGLFYIVVLVVIIHNVGGWVHIHVCDYVDCNFILIIILLAHRVRSLRAAFDALVTFHFRARTPSDTG